MMDNSKQQNQSRFLLAALLCMAVLFGWQFFFAPKPKPTDNANTAQVANTETAAPTPQVQTAPQPQPEAAAITPDDVPNRQITVKSPLYQVKLDSKGALATSWILIKNPRGGREDKPLWADGSTEQNKIPLELILQDNPNREFPFRLSTGDANLDLLLNDRNYQVSETSDVNLEGNAVKQIDFTLNSGDVQLVKSFIFHADSFLTDLQIRATRAGQPIGNAKLLIGAAIGDQNIKHHNYYQIEPEAVAYVGEKINRHVAGSIFNSDATEGSLPVPGSVDWAGVGDAYFAMAAIPATPTQGLEYHGTKIEKNVEPFYDGIISWITRSPKTKTTLHRLTAYVPVNLDGSTTQIYTGSKDYFTLSDYNAKLPGKNIGELINYSWYDWLRWIQRPIAIFLLKCLDVIYGVVGNFGLAIITFTLIFYSIFFPIRWFQSKQFKKAQANAPKMQEIQNKIKELTKKGVPMDDPRMRQLQMEQLKLTKDALPIAGCLPMLLQIPLFVAFYTAITIGMDFRQATFLWLPDLSLADPYHILEFLFAGSMAGSMVLTPTTPAVTDEQKAQQKMMMYFMPAMMLWVMWGYPAGLLLYWFFGNIVSFAQQMIINRLNKTPEPPKEEIVDNVPKSAKKVKPKLSTS
ncbi:MAG TPA: membrane protein insertase YidC [Pyrinomonadaceae bacterium]|jgi:YidC/Oxa1 family membrane protein insertase